ncbi:MAG: UvrD-helicase domain-containing protein [Pelagibacteraceae bacterium]|jgi:DNA helicase-2/ATP-dependent DNA helicase PcrA|nr:UvrD-helicase domain-containing protein [Pelagibacteraceae bacterium]MDP6710357.1 UvrD-helicase domain-containing protein [Pelagibacteraceae bacterium]|tara:strand:+ start:3633 stop:5672 length:2040 start_codon:yes stop_codon:yes gene_type:complete
MEISKQNYLNCLNKNQKEAVIELEGPCLIVAGAGSGKTRVLTSRVAHIIKTKKAWPNQILCVTFTNKAAREMQNRITDLLKEKQSSIPWLGTFHSVCAKILRRHAEAIGLNSHFTIIDQEDQLRLIKNICKAENIDIKKIAPVFILSIINQWKNKGQLPKNINIKRGVPLERNILTIYKNYQERLKILNSCDFGDLILHCATMFENNPDILELYSKNFKYILVDEYQDSNYIQDKWLNLLVKKNNNICCVGDDDQSIYSWRGAEIANFLNFNKTYKDTKIIKLEQNYRSTQNILSAASGLIANNDDRLGKKLWTDGEDGDPVKLTCYKNGKEEAIGISDIIEQKLKKKYSLNNISILVRAIFQTREFEERFLKIGMGYRVIGGTKFYVRTEIKDSIAFLRIVNQKNDDLAFERIINVPRRSIGDNTIKQLHIWTRKNKKSLEDSAIELLQLNKIKPKTKLGLVKILGLFQKWRSDLKEKKHYELMEIILDESGYSKMLKDKKDLESEGRLENLKELIRGMHDFDNLQSFLEHVALASSIDQNWEGEKINLMTIHAAKGLEFDVVFLPGWEEGLFPHQKSLEEKGDLALEEERRLAYVGLTRAKKRSFISFVISRMYRGDWVDSLASRFIDELPEKNIEKEEVKEQSAEDFFFNQDIDYDEGIRSPGWARLQRKKLKRIK